MTAYLFNVDTFLRGLNVSEKIGMAKQKFRWSENLVNKSHMVHVINVVHVSEIKFTKRFYFGNVQN